MDKTKNKLHTKIS